MTATDAPPPYDPSSAPDPNALQLSVATDIREGGTFHLISIQPPAEPASDEKKQFKRAPVDICAVIDVSGSMDDGAPLPGENGEKGEVTELNILDVVKHATRTIMATMNEHDRLAIVAFESSAKVAAQLTFMDEAGKKKVDQILTDLQPLGGTNLWDGLKTGMKLLNTASTPSLRKTMVNFGKKDEPTTGPRLSSIFILTDGMPNVVPPRGHLDSLKTHLDSNPNSHFTINTFGFGYSLQSQLLLRIAELGGGHYGFIPDVGMVGTVFIHALANTMSTFATSCTVDVEVDWEDSNQHELTVLGNHPHTKTSWGAKIDVGDVPYGQSIDLVVQLKSQVPLSTNRPPQQPLINVVAKYRPWTAAASKTEPLQVTSSFSSTLVAQGGPANRLADARYHERRLELVAILQSIFKDCHKPTGDPLTLSGAEPLLHIQSGLTLLADSIAKDPLLEKHASAQALKEDITGQILLAVTKNEYFNKWGKHYLPSLARAHQRQRCGNFKDAGLQDYGAHSPLFTKLRAELDAAFDDLPPPKPSPRRQAAMAHGGGRQNYKAAPKSMRVWNSSAGPCFHGKCTVELEDGSLVTLEELRRGMLLRTPTGYNTVGAVLRTPIPSGETSLCTIGELKVTPWHPIFSASFGKWVFPADIVEPTLESCDAVYSILLYPSDNPDSHIARVGGMRVVTLGHGLTRASGVDARGHAFFGNYERVLNSIKDLPGFDQPEGVALCAGVARGGDGLVCGFAHPDEAKFGEADVEVKDVHVSA